MAQRFKQPKAPSLMEDRTMSRQAREHALQLNRLFLFFNTKANDSSHELMSHEKTAIEKVVGHDAFTSPFRYLVPIRS